MSGTVPDGVRDWTQVNAISDGGRILTGALRWNCGILEQEWRSKLGVCEWRAVPAVLPGDRV